MEILLIHKEMFNPLVDVKCNFSHEGEKNMCSNVQTGDAVLIWHKRITYNT